MKDNMVYFVGIFNECLLLLNEMSVYILFGLIFSGILHVVVDSGTVAKHLGGNSFLSVVKASLFGIPLPLCSCGVLPAALSLKKEGASTGSVLSFLISTPTTGIDSIFATFALMGGFFTSYRIFASFFAGVMAGVLSNIFLKKENEFVKENNQDECKVCSKCAEKHVHTLSEKFKSGFLYAFKVLLSDIGLWFLGGILVGGIISFIMPENLINKYLSSTWISMIVMMFVGIPMYVCSTGSIPIAVSLMLKGLNPGAAFVFLFTGPATNSVAMTLIYRKLGKGAFVIFIGSIVVSALFMGSLLNYLWQNLGIGNINEIYEHSRNFLPHWIKEVSSFLLLAGIIVNVIENKRKRKNQKNNIFIL